MIEKMTELSFIFLLLLIFHILILIVNIRMFKKYPHRIGEGMLGGGILEKKGPVWFTLFKIGLLVIWLIIFFLLIFLPLPLYHRYLFFGILLGAAFFNLIHDSLDYRYVAKSDC